MVYRVKEISKRIKALRDISDISTKQMSEYLNLSESDYISIENGERDFTFTFLYNCAKKFNVDITEIITGKSPTLSSYYIERNGSGLPMKRRSEFQYSHLASLFKGRKCEPFLVTAMYDKSNEDAEIKVFAHKGQEFDYVIEGKLKISIDGKIETLNCGDSIYYNSSSPHGMLAVGGKDCKFLAFVIGECD